MSSKKPLISIIVVALNAGDKLMKTIKSINDQAFEDLEVIVKDGGSTDGSVDQLQNAILDNEYLINIKIVKRPDKSIYEGMNQAIEEASGKYLYFLNCGDYFYKENSLQRAMSKIKELEDGYPHIFYGNVFDELRKVVVSANPKIDGFACYRHLPCHQACIYDERLFSKRKYEPRFKVRADYEHFLWCFYKEKIKPIYIDETIARYEGGGYSETSKNIIRSEKERQEIIHMYMTNKEIAKYKLILALTLSKLRTKLANSEKFSGLYQGIKKMIYKRR